MTMIKRLLHDVVKDDADLEEKLSSSNLLGLVRELNHKYGLVVYEETKRGCAWTTEDNFLLTDEQGLPIGRVFMLEDSYCYHAPYVAKERGADDFDRHTFRSKKLSTLMTTLKRMNIVTSSDEVLNKIDMQIDYLVSKVIGSFRYKSKESLEGDYVHKLLLAMQEGKSLNDLAQTDRDLYLELLDKYNESDILKDSRRQGVQDMFNDTYLIFGDVLGHYIIADAGYEYEAKNQNLTIKRKSPFKRVKDLTGYPRALTALTMNKVHLGEDFRPYAENSLVPMGDKHIPDLELVYGYRGRGTPFDMGVVCLAK
jgi:hypothetical protein